jgi:transcriptional regulator with XRE-family HTH domain
MPKSSDRSDIHKRMMQVVREQGLTQADLVRATGATSPTVTDWFNKGAVPEADKLARVCKALRINGHWLLTGTGPRQAPGEGETQTDLAFALGARAVLTELKRILGHLEIAYFGNRATSLDEAALAAMKVLERTSGRPHRTRRQAP